MPTRLERQRTATKTMPWDGSRIRRGDRGGSTYPTDGITNITPTGVTPGTPGSFTPPGSDVPDNLAELQSLGALGETAAWTEGQSVVLGDASEAYWDGDSWEEGQAPA